MIEITNNTNGSHRASGIRIVGIGNAGVNLVDRMSLNPPPGADLWAVNTDAQSLTSSVAENKLLLGERVTRGLGAGGDPDLGRDAAEESKEELRELFGGIEVLVLVCGLGGGTASAVVPALAAEAVAAGVQTICVTTLPFAFEGRRRAAQADHAYDQLARGTHGLLVFENDRMAEISEPSGRLAETFAAADETLVSACGALARLLQGVGPVNITRGDLLNTIAPGSGRYLFGSGLAEGPNRMHDALARALRSPLLPPKTGFGDASTLLVHFDAPGDFSFVELQAAMREVTRMCDEDTRICFGVSTDANEDGQLGVVLLGLMRRTPQSRPLAVTAASGNTAPAIPAAESFVETVESTQSQDVVSQNGGGEVAAEQEGVDEGEGQTELFHASQLPAADRKTAKKKPKARQEALPFESANRGRFEKTQPTIVGGEDLDVPTFLRLKVKLK